MSIPSFSFESVGKVKNTTTTTLPAGIGGGLSFNPFDLNSGLQSQPVSQPWTAYSNLRNYLVSNFRQLLSEMYVEIGLVQTIVDLPIEDALRGGVKIISHQLEESQIEELRNSLDRDNDLVAIAQGAKWSRLFGGGGVLILTDQDPETPLDIKKITKKEELEFRAVDMWELFQGETNPGDKYDPTIGMQTYNYYSYYGEKVHASRVLKMVGQPAPSFIRPRLRGWGLSVVEVLLNSINQYLKSTNIAYEVLDEFKVDVYKIKALASTLMSPSGDISVKERIALMNYQKNYQNAIVMDKEDDWDHKQLSFTGLAEAMTGIRMQVASDMRMPLTKLFGISAAGFNSGEDDIENYNSMIESKIRGKIKHDILRMIEIKCRKLFEFVPDDLEIEFFPLRVLGGVDEETVKTQKIQRLKLAYDDGIIDDKIYKEALNKGKLLDVSVDLDASQSEGGYDDGLESEETGEGEKDAEGVDDKKDVKDTDDKKENSLSFDKASYDAEGGDSWIDSGRKHFFEDPQDKVLWATAYQDSINILKEYNWKFVTWLYLKRGGKFMSELITWAPGVSLKEIEKQVIFGAMRHFSKNRKAVANSLGVSERTIDTKLSLYYRESELQKR